MYVDPEALVQAFIHVNMYQLKWQFMWFYHHKFCDQISKDFVFIAIINSRKTSDWNEQISQSKSWEFCYLKLWYKSELSLNCWLDVEPLDTWHTIPTYDCTCFDEKLLGRDVSDSLSIHGNIVEEITESRLVKLYVK